MFRGLVPDGERRQGQRDRQTNQKRPQGSRPCGNWLAHPSNSPLPALRALYIDA